MAGEGEQGAVRRERDRLDPADAVAESGQLLSRAQVPQLDAAIDPRARQCLPVRCKRQGVDPEDEGVVLAEEQQAGQGGPDDPAQVVLGRRQRDGTEQVQVTARAVEKERLDLARLGDLTVLSRGGVPIPLSPSKSGI